MSTLNKAKEALATISSELANLRSQQDEARQRIVDIGRQVTALRNSPISLEDFKTYIPGFVKEQGEIYAKSFRFNDWVRPVRSATDLHVPKQERPWSFFEDEDGNQRSSAISLPDASSLASGSNPFGAWCFFAPEATIEKLSTHFDQAFARQWGNTSAQPIAERRIALQQLEEQREEAEDEFDKLSASIAEISKALAG